MNSQSATCPTACPVGGHTVPGRALLKWAPVVVAVVVFFLVVVDVAVVVVVAAAAAAAVRQTGSRRVQRVGNG